VKQYTILGMLLLASCGNDGIFRDRSDDYLAAKSYPKLEIPSELADTTTKTDSILPIPQNIAPLKSSKAQKVPRPNPANSEENLQEFIMQQSAEGNWLLVLRDPTAIWANIYNWLNELGFSLQNDNNKAGELISDAKSTAQINTNLIRTNLTPLSNNLTDNLIYLKLKVNRGIQANSSEIYLNIYQQSNNIRIRQLETELLNNLEQMLKSSSSTPISLLASQYFTGFKPPVLETINDVPTLRFNTDFERAWAYLNHAISRTKIKIDDVDLSLGIFYLNVDEQLPKPNFFKRLFSKKLQTLYELHVTSQTNDQIVTLQNASNEVAQHILESIHQQLSN